MAQTYKMKHNPQGTIYSLLTVESDGQMTMTFHGTDRELSQEATLTEDGRIATDGSLFPGLESGKWQLMDDVTIDHSPLTIDHSPLTIDHSPLTLNPEPLPLNRRQRKPRKPRVEHQEPITINPEPLTVNHQSSSTMKAIGMVAAATVALFVIYETGLLIPLGLIGLATGGILK